MQRATSSVSRLSCPVSWQIRSSPLTHRRSLTTPIRMPRSTPCPRTRSSGLPWGPRTSTLPDRRQRPAHLQLPLRHHRHRHRLEQQWHLCSVRLLLVDEHEAFFIGVVQVDGIINRISSGQITANSGNESRVLFLNLANVPINERGQACHQQESAGSPNADGYASLVWTNTVSVQRPGLLAAHHHPAVRSRLVQGQGFSPPAT